MRRVLFLRKKIKGQNSIEELAYTLSKGIPDLELAIFPERSNTLKGMYKNILFARKNQGDVNHIISPSETYVCLFIRGLKIVTLHDVKSGIAGTNPIWVWLKKKILRSYTYWFVDKIACITEFTRKEMIDMYSPISHKTCVIYNSYNPIFKFEPYEFNETYPLILHIGTVERKNLIRVIQALKGIPCKLYIVGELDDKTKRCLEENHTDFTQEQDVPFSRVVELYRKCDLVSFPTLYEGFGMPVIEAQATGRPVVTSKVASIPEIAGNGACFVNPENIEDMRNGFLKVIKNRDYRNKIVREGLINSKKFSPDRMIDGYLNLYGR